MITQVSAQSTGATIAQKLMGLIMWWVVPSVKGLFAAIIWTITQNPTIYCLPDEIAMGCEVIFGFDKFFPYFFDILLPLYIVAFMFTAIYFIVKTTNPRGRARAKSMLSKLMLGLIVIGMAPMIYQAMLDFSQGITIFIYNEFGSPQFDDMSDEITAGTMAGATILCFVTIVILLIVAIVAFVRFFMVIIYALIFPFLLFLYFFDLTRAFGRKWLRRAVGWIMVPPLQAMFLVLSMGALNSIGPVISSSGLSIAGPFMGFLIALGGLCMVALAPLMINQVMSLVGGGIAAVGLATNSPWIYGFGGLVDGRGSRALNDTKSVLTRNIETGKGLDAATRRMSGGVGPAETGGFGFSALGSKQRVREKSAQTSYEAQNAGQVGEKGRVSAAKAAATVDYDATIKGRGPTVDGGGVTTTRFRQADAGDAVTKEAPKVSIGGMPPTYINQVKAAFGRQQTAKSMSEMIGDARKDVKGYDQRVKLARQRLSGKAEGTASEASDVQLARDAQSEKIEKVREEAKGDREFERTKAGVEKAIAQEDSKHAQKIIEMRKKRAQTKRRKKREKVKADAKKEREKQKSKKEEDKT